MQPSSAQLQETALDDIRLARVDDESRLHQLNNAAKHAGKIDPAAAFTPAMPGLLNPSFAASHLRPVSKQSHIGHPIHSDLAALNGEHRYRQHVRLASIKMDDSESWDMRRRRLERTLRRVNESYVNRYSKSEKEINRIEKDIVRELEEMKSEQAELERLVKLNDSIADETLREDLSRIGDEIDRFEGVVTNITKSENLEESSGMNDEATPPTSVATSAMEQNVSAIPATADPVLETDVEAEDRVESEETQKEPKERRIKFSMKSLVLTSSFSVVALTICEGLGFNRLLAGSIGTSTGVLLYLITRKLFPKSARQEATSTDMPIEENKKPIAKWLEVLKFVLSTFAMVAAGMILTAIDKAFIGQISSLQLASLGPAGATYDCSSYALTFLSTATLSLLAAAPDSGKNTIRSHALFFSVAIGVILTIVLLYTATSAIQLLGGSAEMLPFAQVYLWIRALGAPVDRLVSVCTQFWLAEKNGVVPLLATLVSAVLNVFGDYLLCYKYGTAGAAVATVAASAASAGYLIFGLRRRNLWPREFVMPSFGDFKPFAAFAGPVFLILLLKIFSFYAMTAGATMLGTTAGAAHQVLVSIFFVCAISLGQSMSWAAQTFLPGTKAGTADRRLTNRALLGISTAAVGLGAAWSGIMARSCLGWFTRDPAVAAQAASAAPGVVLATALYIGLLSLEGFCIALKRLRTCVSVSALMAAGTISSIVWRQAHGGLSLVWLWKLQAWVLCFGAGSLGLALAVRLHADDKARKAKEGIYSAIGGRADGKPKAPASAK